MRRRDFITLVGGAAAAWPLATRAQQASMPVIGVLGGPTRAAYAANLASFHQGLKEAGYIEGQNLAVEHRWAEGQYAVAVIQTVGGAPAALAAKAATSNIPIVFHMGADPVVLGMVTSLSRPNSNITGATLMGVGLEAKRLALLREMVPAAALIAMLTNPTNPQAEAQVREVQESARTLDSKCFF
jgi:putative ABC transport system substrate-binding protein